MNQEHSVEKDALAARMAHTVQWHLDPAYRDFGDDDRGPDPTYVAAVRTAIEHHIAGGTNDRATEPGWDVEQGRPAAVAGMEGQDRAVAPASRDEAAGEPDVPVGRARSLTDPIDLDPIEPTAIGPGLAAIPLTPTPWDDAEDGQCAVTPDGTMWQRREGLWYAHPWWQLEDAEQIIATCANPDEWAYDLGWTRKHIEDARGPLTYVLPPAETDGGRA